MNYALIDIHGQLLMEFHTEDEAMIYAKRLAINSKESISVYKRLFDINYKEVIDVKLHGN
jgi:hypothetical protein